MTAAVSIFSLLLGATLCAAEPNIKPRHDPTDQLFRRAPMAEAARSLVVNFGPDLHLAFDTDLGRVHTLWRGGPLNLWGPPYSYSKERFICDFNGTRLYSFPQLVPWWSVGQALAVRFRGISTEGGQPRFRYDVGRNQEVMTVEEAVYGETGSDGWTVKRSFGFPRGVGRDCEFLVFAEAGGTAEVEPGGLLVSGTNGSVHIGAASSAALGWRVATNAVEYGVTNITEAGTESGLAHHVYHGPETRAFLRIPFLSAGAVVEIVMSSAPSVAFSKTPPARHDSLVVLDAGKERRPPRGDDAYRLEHFPLPPEAEMMITGMDWLPNGDLAVCTWLGEIYLIRGAAGTVEKARYHRYARGLNEPLGLTAYKGELYVSQKGELTRVRDTDGDGVADTFDCVSSAWGYSGNYHSYSFGPLVTSDGWLLEFITGQRGLYDLPYQGWALRIRSDGNEIEPFCFGLRVPHGWGLYGPDREIFVTDNQGNWIGACRLNCLQPGKFYGFPSSTPSARQTPRAEQVEPPVLWFPRSLAPSASGFDTAPDGFGPFAGQMFIGDFQNSVLMRAVLEKVNGRWQGAVFPFAEGFLSGVNRVRFGPDGKAYVGGGKRTWSTAAPKEYSLDRVSFTGTAPFEVKAVQALPDGFALTFTEPVEEKDGGEAANYLVKQFTYHYHAEYGSPEFDHAGKVGATELPVARAQVDPSGKMVRLQVPGLKTGYVTAVKMVLTSKNGGRDLRQDTFFYTLNEKPAAQ